MPGLYTVLTMLMRLLLTSVAGLLGDGPAMPKRIADTGHAKKDDGRMLDERHSVAIAELREYSRAAHFLDADGSAHRASTLVAATLTHGAGDDERAVRKRPAEELKDRHHIEAGPVAPV